VESKVLRDDAVIKRMVRTCTRDSPVRCDEMQTICAFYASLFL